MKLPVFLQLHVMIVIWFILGFLNFLELKIILKDTQDFSSWFYDSTSETFKQYENVVITKDAAVGKTLNVFFPSGILTKNYIIQILFLVVNIC